MMYNEENIIWINQQLYYFKDKVYNSNGSLELVISSTTQQEYKYFSPVNLNLKVSFENDFSTQKLCSLNISKIIDLNQSIKEVLEKYPNGSLYTNNNIEIVKRYNNDKNFIIKFKESKNTKEKCVIFIIAYNESNFTNVIIPYNEFLVVYKILKDFEETYIERTKELKIQQMMSEQISLLKIISNNIQSLPSHLIDFSKPIEPHFDSSPRKIEQQPELMNQIESESQIKELDKFLGGNNLSNVDIPYLEKDDQRASSVEPSSKREIESYLIDNVLKNDISILEDILNSVYSNEDPISSLCNTLYNKNSLINITEDDNKSISFISNWIFKSMLRNYLDNNIQIPNSIPMLKYKLTNYDEPYINEKQIAIDLLMIHGYLKSYRTKIESKTDDINHVKSIMLLSFRTYTDPFCFTFLEAIPFKTIISNVLERFDFYKNKGFFNKFDEIIKLYNLPSIEKDDISNFLNNVIKIIESYKNSMYINNMHDEYYKRNEIKIQSKNNLTLEQIINNIVKIEVSKKLKPNESYESIISKFYSIIPIPIKQIYLEKEDKNKTNLVRVVSNNISEVPELLKNKIMEFVYSLGEDNFNISDFNLNIRDMSENIVKALYIWKPKEDSQLKTNYIYFTDKIKNLTVNKQDIINLLLGKKETEKNSEWDEFNLDSF